MRDELLCPKPQSISWRTPLACLTGTSPAISMIERHTIPHPCYSYSGSCSVAPLQYYHVKGCDTFFRLRVGFTDHAHDAQNRFVSRYKALQWRWAARVDEEWIKSHQGPVFFDFWTFPCRECSGSSWRYPQFVDILLRRVPMSTVAVQLQRPRRAFAEARVKLNLKLEPSRSNTSSKFCM